MASTSTTPSFPPQILPRRLHPPPPNSHTPVSTFSRRSLLLSTATAPLPLLPTAVASADPAVTDRVFLDFSLCPSYFRSDRPLGSDLASCLEPEPLGRVVLGLYGKLLPITVSNFKATCASAAYRGALVHKVLQGQYFAAGRQGRRDRGEIRPPPGLARNTETVDPSSFQLRHAKPGTLSLCLSENDDYESVRMDPEYRNVEFLMTTGPGPCPQLDNQNIVFGIVLEGLDVVTTIASFPTYKPPERIRLFNDLAEFLGDERAQNARAMWNRPLKTVYISDCGELKVVKPCLPPTLP